jgi:nitric oxide synthase oxygenase domain/subunit
MGTYQRNRMTAIGALLKGMIGPTTCKYRLHVEMNTFRPELEFSQKQLIHEHAMAQGEIDPLRTDYSRYFNKLGGQGERAEALDLGHLRSLRYHNRRFIIFHYISRSFMSYRHASLAESVYQCRMCIE